MNDIPRSSWFERNVVAVILYASFIGVTNGAVILVPIRVTGGWALSGRWLDSFIYVGSLWLSM